ncbi:MAG: hypothetical protein N4A74_12385 [Carboxylicivirga sp.]|jgi:hypothetical protein|nr:hypothetical protein [Carboxylicivirga sp.]
MIEINIPDEIVIRHENNLLPKVKRRINKKIGRLPNGRPKNFLLFLQDAGNNYQRLKDLLIGKPPVIRSIIRHVLDNYRDLFFAPGMQEDFKKILKHIFNYESFRDDYTGWGAYELTTQLGVAACPYCNRQYTHTYYSEDQKTRPELDHYYPQYKYPFIGISLYNLIPSCHICNSNLKHKDDFYEDQHIHPYENSFGDDAVFQTDFVINADGTYNLNLIGKDRNVKDFKLKLRIDESSHLKTQIENSNNTFLIEELYQNHKDYVLELIRKSVLYTPKKLEELSGGTFGNLFSSKEELVQTLLSNYIKEEDLNKRVLAKLTKDIWAEFNMDSIWK